MTTPIEKYAEATYRNAGMIRPLSIHAMRQQYREFADEMFKDFVRRMMHGWCIKEASYVLGEGLSMGHYAKDEQVAMLEAFEGDAMRADFAALFGYWANDIQTLAAEHLNLAIKRGEVVAIDPPPQDGGEYWYDIDDHVWHSVERDVVDLDAEKGGEEDCSA